MKKKLTVFILFIGILSTAKAQDYKHAIGVRIGRLNSLDYRLNLQNSNRLEFGERFGFGSFDNSIRLNNNLSIYYNHAWSIKEGINFYFGGGINNFLSRRIQNNGVTTTI